jgi:hypothetical protein
METPGHRFATALAAKDAAALRDVLDQDIDFRALTPGREWAAASPDEVLEVLFGHWFEDDDRIDRLVDVAEGAPVEDTGHVAYRFAVTNPAGTWTVEQQAYYRSEGDRIGYLRVLCSGYRPVR